MPLVVLAAAGRTAGAADAPQLAGSAIGFAGVPWGSSSDVIKAKLAKRGYVFAETGSDGTLVFTQNDAPVETNVFEVLGSSQRLVKTLVSVKPAAGDVVDVYRSASAALITKLGKPSAKYDKSGSDGTLGTFWLYKDGSAVYVRVTKEQSVETVFESARFKASDASRGAPPAAGSARSTAASIFVPPPGWTHTQGTSDGRGTWTRPGDTGYSENIDVEEKIGITSLDALLQAETQYISGLPDRFGYAPTDITLCGNHPAKYLSYTYSSPSGLPITSEVVIAVFGSAAYALRYNKSISQYADTAAEHAITTLCPR